MKILNNDIYLVEYILVGIILGYRITIRESDVIIKI